MKPLYVFASGPYSAPTPMQVAENVRLAIEAADFIAARGHYPVVPHLMHFWDMQHPKPYEHWMQQCFAQIRRSDALVRLPNHEMSSGGMRELALARELKLTIFDQLQQIPNLR